MLNFGGEAFGTSFIIIQILLTFLILMKMKVNGESSLVIINPLGRVKGLRKPVVESGRQIGRVYMSR